MSVWNISPPPRLVSAPEFRAASRLQAIPGFFVPLPSPARPPRQPHPPELSLLRCPNPRMPAAFLVPAAPRLAPSGRPRAPPGVRRAGAPSLRIYPRNSRPPPATYDLHPGAFRVRLAYLGGHPSFPGLSGELGRGERKSTGERQFVEFRMWSSPPFLPERGSGDAHRMP